MGKNNPFMEKRIFPRTLVKVPVKYRLVESRVKVESLIEWQKKERHTQTIDISLCGMSLAMDRPLPADSIPRFDIFLPNQTKALTVYVKVVWSNKTGAGLRFIMIKNEDTKALKDFLDKAAPEQETFSSSKNP